MKKETLEEAASRLLYSKYPFHPPQDSGYWKDMFLEGAKWQAERMYSEQEVKEALLQMRKTPMTFVPDKRMYSEEDMAESFVACWKSNVPDGIECKLSFKEWFEQFKKK
jgi:hypothetical protein